MLDHSSARPVLERCAPLLQGKDVLDLMTGGIREARDFAELLAAAEAFYLKGAIQCFPGAIGTGDALIYASGDEAVWARRQLLLQAVSPAIRYWGASTDSCAAADAALSGAFATVAMGAWMEALGFLKDAGFDLGQVKLDVGWWVRQLARDMNDALDEAREGRFETTEATVDIHAAALANWRKTLLNGGHRAAITTAALHTHMISGCECDHWAKRTGQQDVTRPQRFAKLRQHPGNPMHRIIGVAEARCARSHRCDGAVDFCDHAAAVKIEFCMREGVGSKHKKSRGAIVRNGIGKGDLPIRDTAINNLDRGNRLVDGGDDRLQRGVGILKIAAHGKGNFSLGFGVNDQRRVENASVRNFHVRKQRTEIRLVDTELLADRISSQSNFSADKLSPVRLPVPDVYGLHGISAFGIKRVEEIPQGFDWRAVIRIAQHPCHEVKFCAHRETTIRQARLPCFASLVVGACNRSGPCLQSARFLALLQI